MATPSEPEVDAPQEARRLERLRILDLSAVGLAFPIALLIGYFAGRAIGGWLGSAQLGGLIGALLGIAGGFYNLFKMVSRLAPRGSASNHEGATPPSPGTAAAPGAAVRRSDPPGAELDGEVGYDEADRAADARADDPGPDR
jgi:hypothetical protein